MFINSSISVYELYAIDKWLKLAKRWILLVKLYCLSTIFCTCVLLMKNVAGCL